MESINVVVDDGYPSESTGTANFEKEDDLFPQAYNQEVDLEEETSQDNEEENNESEFDLEQGDAQSKEVQSLQPSARVKLNHPSSQVIGNITDQMKTQN